MRKALLISFALTGLAPVVIGGCAGKTSSGVPVAKKSGFSDLPGVSSVAALFKADGKKPAVTPSSNKNDPFMANSDKTKPTPELMVAWAKMQEHGGKLDEAEANYKAALKIDPNHLPALLGHAHLLDRQNKLDQATVLYKKAVEKHPAEASAHNDLGLCYARRQMLNESVVSLSKAVELKPNKKLYRNNIATVLVEQDRVADALTHLSVGEQPALAHYNLACLLHQKGKTPQAAMYFAKAAELDPSLAAAREWADKLAVTTGPRLTSVRPIDSGSIYDGSRNTMASGREIINGSSGSASNSHGYEPSWPARTSVDNSSWNKPVASGAAWDNAAVGNGTSSNAVNNSRPTTSFGGAQNGGSWQRGSAYAGDVPPTPDNATNYATRTSAVDELPPIDSTPLPRY